MWTLQYVNVEMALRLCLHRCARACIVSDYQCYISARAHFSVLTAQTFFFFFFFNDVGAYFRNAGATSCMEEQCERSS